MNRILQDYPKSTEIKQFMSRPLIVFLLVVMIVILLILGLLQMLYQSGFVPQSEIVKRQINDTSEFEFQWEKSLISFPTTIDNGKFNREGVFLNVQGSSVILPVSDRDAIFFLGRTLKSFDLRTSDENWRRSINFFKTIAYGGNSQSTFIILEDVDPPLTMKNKCNSNLPICRAVKIIKYDNVTGKKDWTTYQFNMNDIKALGVSEESVNLIGTAYRGEYTSKISLDVDTGSTISFQGNDMVADAIFHQILEKINFDPYEVVSNYTVAENYIFFLSNEGIKQRLWAVNKDTFEIAGQVEFSGSEFDTLVDARLRGFVVDTFEDNVVIYLGDSEQLFVFSFIPLTLQESQ